MGARHRSDGESAGGATRRDGLALAAAALPASMPIRLTEKKRPIGMADSPISALSTENGTIGSMRSEYR